MPTPNQFFVNTPQTGFPQRLTSNGDGTYSPTQEFVFNPIGAHQYASGTVAIQTLTPPVNASKLLIQTSDHPIRFSLGGTGTTLGPQVGFLLEADDVPVIIHMSPDVYFRFRQKTSTGTAIVQYQWGN